MVDGGKGQVNIGRGVLKELDLDIPICGLVKDDFIRQGGELFIIMRRLI